MEIVDLTPKYEDIYCLCLEDWSDEMKEAGNHKKLWYQRMKNKGLGVKVAIEDGKVCGMIQYVPAEYGFAEGDNFYFIHCIWVHGYKKGIGNFQKRGIGKELLKAAEKDVKNIGAEGMAAWGISLPFWMKASWFKKQGYKKVDKNGMAVLMWKSFSDDAKAPKWIKQKKSPDPIKEKVRVSVFRNGWCPSQDIVFNRAQRASAEFGEKVVFEEIDTSDRNTYMEYGISDALFINGKNLRTGSPPSYKKIKRQIGKRLKKLTS
jgi:N-acetylglutamate synthase-like GNAT family acetyltransferase